MCSFNDETRATLDRLDCWANGWIYFGDECHQHLQCQQRGGEVILWAGIIGDRLVGPVTVPEVFKVIAATYCNLLNDVCDPWLDHIPLSLLRTPVFMHDNTLSHSVRVTQAFLGSYSIQCERLIVWPPASLDLNLIKNLWSIIK